MKNYFKICCFIVFALLLSSCATTIKTSYSGQKLDKIQSITLLAAMIGEVKQPLLPIVDAGLFNRKTNLIADEIINIQRKRVDNYREIVAACLENNFNCEVLYGNSLHNMIEFNEMKILDKPHSLRNSNNEHFPMIIISSNDINPFSFKNGDVLLYFEEPFNYKHITTALFEYIDTDLIAISYSFLNVTGTSLAGLTGRLRLETYIYI